MRQATGSQVFVVTLDGIVPHYARRTFDEKTQKTIDVPISDFVFDPVATITVAEDQPRTIFVVEVLGRQFQLPSDVLDTSAKFEHWCGTVNLGWSGTLNDLRGVRYLLRTAEVPEWDGTTVVGLHDHSWVLPNETFGGNGPVYVKHEFGEWQTKTSLEPRELDAQNSDSWLDALNSLASLHLRSIMTPILGWLAAAPLRSLCSEFPILNISGGSGTGKTTLTKTVLQAFGFWMGEETNLTGATPHAVVGAVTMNNAFPQWFDEYRPTIRPDTFDRINNVIRDAWNGGAISTGGTMRDNVMSVRNFAIRAPIIITGEQSFTEQSHLDRMVTVDLSTNGRNVEELQYLLEDGLFNLKGFGRKYLEWLVSDVDADVKQPPVNLDRQTYCREVVRWGYGMLARFLDTYFGGSVAEETLPVFTYQRVELERNAQVNPYDQLIEVAISDNGECAWSDTSNDRIYVRIGATITWNRKSQTNIKLPSDVAQDFGKYLRTTYNAIEDKNHSFGRAWYFNAADFEARVGTA